MLRAAYDESQIVGGVAYVATTLSEDEFLGEVGLRLPAGEARTLVYRGQRTVPHRRRSFRWFATVSHWEIEDHEVQVDFERGLVSDIQARIRRSQPGATP